MTAQDLLRQRFTTDPHRPRYHFLPPSNWMNDPNGVIQWQGAYHLFYQYNPFGALWGNMSWGHAVSADLVHWRDLPLALVPTPGGADEAGVFSGCTVDNEGTPTIVYTGTRGEHCEVQTQCIATSHDNLLTWDKYAGNPVISNIPPEAGQTHDFRDPFVWREADGWYMALASRIEGMGGVIFLYRSPNLTDWEYLHPLLTDNRPERDSGWECPNFFRLGDQWVLIISAYYTNSSTSGVIYYVGTYQNHVFTPTCQGVLDYGHLYAPLSTLDEQNRRVLFGWLREARPPEAMERAGWSGVQSIPRILSLDSKGWLCAAPAPELAAIRGAHHHVGAVELAGDVALDTAGLALDIEAEFQPQVGGSCGIALLCAPDGSARTEIGYDAASGRLVVRQITDGAATILHQCPHELAPGEALKLRILLDGSVIETIANERTSVTSRVYARQAGDHGVHVFGANTRLVSLDSWEMRSIW